MMYHRSNYQSMTQAADAIKQYRENQAAAAEEAASGANAPAAVSVAAAATQRSRPATGSPAAALEPLVPIDGATAKTEELQAELEAKGIAIHPPRRDPFAPSRDNPLVPDDVVKMIAERESSVRLPLRFRDASVYQYPVAPTHPAYRTTASVYGSQPPRAIELPSAYYSTSSEFTRDLGTVAYRNNSLECSRHAARPGRIATAVTTVPGQR